MPTDTDLKFSLCWYDKKQWALLAQIDPDGIDDTYEEWRKSANEAISYIEASGRSVEKISINILELQKKGAEAPFGLWKTTVVAIRGQSPGRR